MPNTFDKINVIIHPGFAHSGTSSLQQQYFSKISNCFYAGLPYGELGGLFSSIKYHDFEDYDQILQQSIVRDYIKNKMGSLSTLIISDETLVEQPEIYYTPTMMPKKIIAERLLQLFGKATILFTIRNQYDYVLSNYLILKKNYIDFDLIQIEPFDKWFYGNFSQTKNLYLRNINYIDTINVYSNIFGKDSIKILPLELLTSSNEKNYLNTLDDLIGLHSANLHPMQYKTINSSDKSNLQLSQDQIKIIDSVCATGNKNIQIKFNLSLKNFGYPYPCD
jgi:hypothetical protein